MKYFKLTAVILVSCTTFISSCKKDQIEIKSLASIKVVNAIAGGTSAKMGSRATTVTNNNSMDFGLTPGLIDLYIWPTTDSLTPYYNSSITVHGKEIYSLFLGGTPANVDAVIIKESLPVRVDSTFGLRFINLSPGSPEVKVTLSTSNSVSEFGNVIYKSITDFKAYPAGVGNNSYTFQVRNASTNTVIASTTITGTSNTTGIPRYKNVTLILRGIVGGTPSAGLSRVNHF